MQTLRILSGIAVLLLTLHFTHVLHHFFVEAPHDSPVFWAGMVTAVTVWLLSFVGGCLLLKRSGWCARVGRTLPSAGSGQPLSAAFDLIFTHYCEAVSRTLFN